MSKMKILVVKGDALPHPMENAGDRTGITLRIFTPPMISAFASLRLARMLKTENFDIIEVCRLKDAMAAISAVDITKGQAPKIVYRVKANTQVPMSIVKDIKNKVDLWLFESQRLAEAYPADLKAKLVVPPTPPSICEIAPPQFGSPLRLAWIGDINNPAQLRKVIEVVDTTDGVCLRICGAGKAADVMPVVKMSRHLPSAARIEWQGESIDINKEIAAADALVATDEDLTVAERTAMYTGRAVLRHEEIATWASSPHGVDAPKHIDDLTVQAEAYRHR